MRPETDQILNVSAIKIVTDFAPALGTQYGQGMAQVVAGLLMMAAQEFDRAADIRFAENEDMRGLFRDLSPQIADAGLRGELEAASRERDESLRVSALNTSNENLRRLLIRLHVRVEEAGGDTKPIWDVLKAMAARRTLSLPG